MTGATLRERLDEHPWRVIGGAFVVGAWLALDPPRLPRHRLGRTVFALIGSLTVRVVRELATRELLGRVGVASPAAWAVQSNQAS